jgi:hypothetical protein
MGNAYLDADAEIGSRRTLSVAAVTLTGEVKIVP